MSQAHSRSAVLAVPLVVAQPPSVRAHSGTINEVRFSRLKVFSLVTLRDNNPYISIMDLYLPHWLGRKPDICGNRKEFAEQPGNAACTGHCSGQSQASAGPIALGRAPAYPAWGGNPPIYNGDQKWNTVMRSWPASAWV